MKKRNNWLWFRFGSTTAFAVGLLLLFIAGCKEKNPVQLSNEALIYCDQDFQHVMELQREVYEAGSPKEKLNIQYISGEEVLQKLLKGQAQVAIIGRKLTDEEMIQVRKADSSNVREHLMAKDAVAVVVGKNNPLKSLNYAAFLEEIKKGKSSHNLVFDNKQSGVVRSFNFLKNANSKNLFALDSIKAVVDYVNADGNALGFLPLAKFSDEYNKEQQELLTKIKILPVEIIDSSGQKLSIAASQSEIALNDYPLIRPINYIIAKPREDVSRNFINYLYKQRGAKVFLKAGLIPAIMPERDFIINSDEMPIVH